MTQFLFKSVFGQFLLSFVLQAALNISHVYAEFSSIDDRIDAIAENVRSNEELYRNIAIEGESNYRFIEAKYFSREMVGLVDHTKETFRVVFQGPMYFINNEVDQFTTTGVKVDPSQTIGYDGSLSRGVFGHQFCNINNERVDDVILYKFSPHMIPFANNPLKFRTNLYSIIASDRCKPLSYMAGGNVAGLRTKTDLIDEEKVDGLKCFKFRLRFLEQGSDDRYVESYNVYFWLAVDRNYIPIQLKQYAFTNQDYPSATFQLTDLREIAPGVWYPFMFILKGYDNMCMLQDKRHVLNAETVTKIASVKLDPHYPIGLFRDIKCGKNMTLHIVQNGKIVETIKPGSSRSAWFGRSLRSPWFAVSIVVVCGLLILLFFRSRKNK